MKFEVILADPPWPYNQRTCSRTRFGTGVHGHYPIMKLDEIKRLPVGDLAAPNAMLFIWAAFPRLDAAMEVIKAWGFYYKTVGFNYIKLNLRNGKPFFGVGYYAKSGSEICLLATRGKPIKPAVNTVSSTILAPRGRHSEKPIEAIERIEQMYPRQSKVEIFARRARAGWTSIGNEIDGEDVRNALSRLIKQNISCQTANPVLESFTQNK